MAIERGKCSSTWHLLAPKEGECRSVLDSPSAEVVNDGSNITYLNKCSGHKATVTFDPESLLSFTSMGSVNGTVLTLMPVLKEIVMSLAVGLITTILVMFFVNPKHFQVAELNVLINFLMAFLGFLTSIFVNSAFNGWLRVNQCVNDLFLSIKTLYVELYVYGTKPIDRAFDDVRGDIRRWGFLSVALMAREAPANWDRGIDWDEDFEVFRKEGLVTKEELGLLSGKHIKAALPWVWIRRSLVELSETGKLPKKDTSAFVSILSEVSKAQQNLHNIAQAVLIQVPYQYAHMIAFLIHVFNIMNAIRSGGEIGASLGAYRFNYSSGEQVLPKAYQCETILVNFLLIILVPLVYHAFLSIACDLSIPFGTGDTDLPIDYMSTRFQYECNDMDVLLQMPCARTPATALESHVGGGYPGYGSLAQTGVPAGAY